MDIEYRRIWCNENEICIRIFGHGRRIDCRHDTTLAILYIVYIYLYMCIALRDVEKKNNFNYIELDGE